jgi:hypothetical protein
LSALIDAERKEMLADERVERAKRRIAELMDINRLTYEGLTVALIASRLSFTRHKVRALQCWLGWRYSATAEKCPTRRWPRKGRWTMEYPEARVP